MLLVSGEVSQVGGPGPPSESFPFLVLKQLRILLTAK